MHLLQSSVVEREGVRAILVAEDGLVDDVPRLLLRRLLVRVLRSLVDAAPLDGLVPLEMTISISQRINSDYFILLHYTVPQSLKKLKFHHNIVVY